MFEGLGLRSWDLEMGLRTSGLELTYGLGSSCLPGLQCFETHVMATTRYHTMLPDRSVGSPLPFNAFGESSILKAQTFRVYGLGCRA